MRPSRLLRLRRRDPTSPPQWAVRVAWIGGIVVATTLVWMWLEFGGGLS